MGISKHACISLCFHLMTKVFTDQCIMSYDNIRQFLTPSSPRNTVFVAFKLVMSLHTFRIQLDTFPVSIILCVFKWVYTAFDDVQ